MHIKFYKGDSVLWSYKHYIATLGYVMTFKRGLFVRNIKSRNTIVPTHCLVRFVENKNATRVPLSELNKAVK